VDFRRRGLLAAAGLGGTGFAYVGTGVKVVSGFDCCVPPAGVVVPPPGVVGVCAAFLRRFLFVESKPVTPAPEAGGLP